MRVNSGYLIVIKIGGSPAQNPDTLTALLSDIAKLNNEAQIVLVHGGGAAVSEITRQYGIEPRFINGIRQTSEKEMDIIDMGLAGKMNSSILRSALSCGLNAVGLSGIDSGLFTGEAIAEGNRTGKVTSVRTELILHLHAGNYVPVISSVSTDQHGRGLNINADDAAQALAEALKPDQLIFVSDIPGVMADGEVLPVLNRETIEDLIENGSIYGGMIPKVNNALHSVAAGVGEVIIGTINENSSLADLTDHVRGSRIVLE